VGKAPVDGALNAGWLLGHFHSPGDPRHSDEVEIKWGVHPVGESRAEWVRSEERTTVAVLISGRFRLLFPERDALLAEAGDYVVWGKGVDHSWVAEEESVVLIVRWPSVPGYRVGSGSDGPGSAGSNSVGSDSIGSDSAGSNSVGSKPVGLPEAGA